ncbi:MAG: hypothetical protein ACLQDV_13790 [Candidatus Binataceae bacterium]
MVEVFLKQAKEPKAAGLGLVSCLLAVLVLIVLPTLRVHRYGRYYRANEVTQNCARHSFVTFDNDRSGTLAEQAAAQPAFRGMLTDNGEPGLALVVTSEFVAPVVSLPHLLKRLRLKTNRSSDPFLSI